MTSRGSLRVERPEGSRWDLALDLLRSGEGSVAIGNVELSRHAGPPGADGRIQVAVLADVEPQFITSSGARGYVDRARSTLAALRKADDRFGELLTQYGTAWELVHDYSTGAVTMARIGENGGLEWKPAYAPST